MAKRKLFGDLSRATRDRYAKKGEQEYNLSRKSVREMYNRGTYNPGSRGENSVPQKFRNTLLDNAHMRLRAVFGDRLGWKGEHSDKHVISALRHASKTVLAVIADATENELEEWTKVWSSPMFRSGAEPSTQLERDLLFFDSGINDYHNVLWYH